MCVYHRVNTEHLVSILTKAPNSAPGNSFSTVLFEGKYTCSGEIKGSLKTARYLRLMITGKKFEHIKVNLQLWAIKDAFFVEFTNHNVSGQSKNYIANLNITMTLSLSSTSLHINNIFN